MKPFHVAAFAVSIVALGVSLLALYRTSAAPAAPVPAPEAGHLVAAPAAARAERWIVVERVPDRPGLASLEAPKVRETLIAPDGEIVAIPDQHIPFFAAIEDGQEVLNPPLAMRAWKRLGNVRDPEAEPFAKVAEGKTARETLFGEPTLFYGTK